MSLEFGGLDPAETKRHSEVEALMVTGDNHGEVRRKVLSWLAEEMN